MTTRREWRKVDAFNTPPIFFSKKDEKLKIKVFFPCENVSYSVSNSLVIFPISCDIFCIKWRSIFAVVFPFGKLRRSKPGNLGESTPQCVCWFHSDYRWRSFCLHRCTFFTNQNWLNAITRASLIRLLWSKPVGAVHWLHIFTFDFVIVMGKLGLWKGFGATCFS